MRSTLACLAIALSACGGGGVDCDEWLAANPKPSGGSGPGFNAAAALSLSDWTLSVPTGCPGATP